MDHFLTILQLLFIGIGLFSAVTAWISSRKTPDRHMIHLAIFITALSLIFILNALVTYGRLNFSLEDPGLLFNLMVIEQIPRLAAVGATASLATGFLGWRWGQWLNRALFLVMAGCVMLMIFGGYTPGARGNMPAGWTILTNNAFQLAGIGYSIILSLWKYRPIQPGPREKLVLFWVRFSLLSFPGFVVDFLLYPSLITEGLISIPVFAFYRLYYIVLSLGVLYYLLKPEEAPSAISENPSSPRHDLTQNLTPREREVLDLLLEGASNQYMADKLGVSLSTVKVHLYNIFQKTGAGNRLELLFMINGTKKPTNT